MASLNKVMIIGNVGMEPEMRFTPTGKPSTSFRVAVNHVYTSNEGERKEDTEWFSVVTWSRLAEICNQMLTKGQSVYVEGRLKTRSWEGQDGQKHYKTEIVASQVLFLGAKRNTDDTTPEGEGEGELAPEDIPF